MVYILSELLYNYEQGWNHAISWNLDGTGENHVKISKTAEERQILDIFTFLEYID